MTRRAAALRLARAAVLVILLVGAVTLAPAAPARGGPVAPSPTTAPTATTGPATTAPERGPVPTTTVPPSAPVLPDLALRRAPNGPWIGRGRAASPAPITIDASVRTGQAVTFVFRIRHDGAAVAELALAGRGRDPRATVRWRLDGEDVTDAVDDGDLLVEVEPGGHRDLTLTVRLGPTGPAHLTIARTLTARAVDGGARERARAIVARGPLPVRFHDVGEALGLPRDTHSFDIDVAPIDDDAIDDLVISTHGQVEILLNHRPGLESVLRRRETDLHACTVGDANGDARSDVYCTLGAENGAGSKRNRLYVQGDGVTFENRARAFGVDDPFGRGRHPTFVDLDHRGGLDLFVGNENPRQDDNRSLNRTFLRPDGDLFVDTDLGMRADVGGLCAQAFDQDGDGWQDLLVCGGAGPATVGWNPDQNQLHLFGNVTRPDGRRRLVDVAPRLGVDITGVQAARLAHLDDDRRADLVVVTRNSVAIWPGRAGGTFGLPVFREDLQAGHWVTLADVDGRRGLDLFVVQGCGGPDRLNIDDRLFLDLGPGWGWEEAVVPTGVAGCGDTAEALDIDGDGVDDLVVGNGQWSAEGPIQVLTAGHYWG